MTVMDLIERRNKLQAQLDKLAWMTNNGHGKDMSLWEIMTNKQRQIKEIDNKLNSMKV